ncbi:MAG: HAD family hydrolase [bacterium]|nr:HAD family hydrolase [bacterium]
MINKAIFLDRDGTLNYDYGYIKDPEKIKLFYEVEISLKLLKSSNFKLIIVSNQSGVARGYMSISQVNLINKCLQEELSKLDISIDEIYICPHHIEGKIKKYTIDCPCRKPKPGMLLEAKDKFNLDLSQSFLIGDKISDIGAGFNVGCKTVLVLTGYGKEELERQKQWPYQPNYIAKDLYSAASWITNHALK